MKNQNNCNCRTMLTASHCFWGMGSYLMITAIIFMTVAIAHEPLPGQHVATFFRLLWVISVAAMGVWRISILQPLIMYYLPQRHIFIRLGLLLLLAVLPPVLEIAFLIKVREPQEVYSFWLEFRELNAVKLANAIKEGDYFAKADGKDDPSVSIVTSIGLVSALIRSTTPSIYMYIHLEDNDLPTIKLPVGSDWRIEAAADGSAHAAVFEVGYCPEAFDEQELAEILSDALDELISYFRRFDNE